MNKISNVQIEAPTELKKESVNSLKKTEAVACLVGFVALAILVLVTTIAFGSTPINALDLLDLKAAAIVIAHVCAVVALGCFIVYIQTGKSINELKDLKTEVIYDEFESVLPTKKGELLKAVAEHFGKNKTDATRKVFSALLGSPRILGDKDLDKEAQSILT